MRKKREEEANRREAMERRKRESEEQMSKIGKRNFVIEKKAETSQEFPITIDDSVSSLEFLALLRYSFVSEKSILNFPPKKEMVYNCQSRLVYF